MEMCGESAAAQGMRPEVEAAVQVAARFDGLDRRVLVYFKLAGAALLHQSEHAAPLQREQRGVRRVLLRLLRADEVLRQVSK